MIKFQITKERVYEWKRGPFGRGATMKWMTFWNVRDESGNFVAGGYTAGNNVRSARATFDKKSEAQAWIDGYNGVPFERSNYARGAYRFYQRGARALAREATWEFCEGVRS